MAQDTTLVEFRAGKMKLEGGMLRADPRKGLIRLLRTEADELLHFQWFERTAAGATPEPETDIVVFPSEAKFRKIERAGARLYKLEFEDQDRDAFFWMQNPKADGDAELEAAVNAVLSEGFEMEEGASSGDEMQEDAPAPDAAALAAALAASLPSGSGQTRVPFAAQAAGSSAVIHASDLAALLSHIAGGNAAPAAGGQSDAASAALAARMQRAARGPGLADVLRPEVIAPLLQADGMAERLAPFLPEGQRHPSDIADLVQSPQFRNQLEIFSAALQSGQLDMSQFGLNAQGFSVADFLESIQQSVDATSAQQHDNHEPPARTD